MNWIDSYEVTLRRYDGRPPTAEEQQVGDNITRGVSYQTDDGSRYGTWRVTLTGADENPDRWMVWDLRSVGVTGQARAVMSGFKGPQNAMRFAERYAGSRALRLGVAVTSGLGRIIREVRREWAAG